MTAAREEARRQRTTKGGPRIPGEPFVRWCERQLRLIANHGALGIVPTEVGDGEAVRVARHGVLARRLGVEVRTLWRYLNGWDSQGRPTTLVPRYAVEDMLHRAGEDFYAVYPEYLHERDIELEPDVWCPTCAQTTTPLHGWCLWCDRRVADADGVGLYPAPDPRLVARRARAAWLDSEVAWQEAPPPTHDQGERPEPEWLRDDLAA